MIRNHLRTPARLLALSALVTLAFTQAAASEAAPSHAGTVQDGEKKQDPPKPKRVPKPGNQGGGGKTPPRPDVVGGGKKDPSQDPKVPAFTGEKDPKAKLTIEFGKEKHSFGSTRQGDLLEHTFELVSAGENPVKIRQASPTCGCTVTAVQILGDDGEPTEYKLGDPIAPGKKIQITGKLDTAKKAEEAASDLSRVPVVAAGGVVGVDMRGVGRHVGAAKRRHADALGSTDAV